MKVKVSGMVEKNVWWLSDFHFFKRFYEKHLFCGFLLDLFTQVFLVATEIAMGIGIYIQYFAE